MYDGSHVLVTGASGLIGSHLVETLEQKGALVRALVHKREPLFQQRKNIEIVSGDLTRPDFCASVCKGMDYVFHLAVETGSIVKNAKHPAGIMTPTILMDFNMLKVAHDFDIKKYLYSSCACVYPNDVVNMQEDQAWNGPPPKMHETISWSKRISELQCQSFHKEYGDKIAIVRPSNTYGPYDIFDVENSHVISAFIKKACSKVDPFVIWGNGEQIREFVYARDVAQAMVLALENYAIADPVNIAGGEAIRIKDLASKIISLVGYKPKMQFDESMPTGHMKRVLDSRKLRENLSFVPSTSLDDGLQNTITWYQREILEK